MATASWKLAESQETLVTPEDMNKLSQLLHQTFARLLLCLRITLSSPSLPISQILNLHELVVRWSGHPSLRQVRGAPQQKNCWELGTVSAAASGT